MSQVLVQDIPFSVAGSTIHFHDLVQQYILYKKKHNQIPFSPLEYSRDDQEIDFSGSMGDLIVDLQTQHSKK